jgi:protein-tyrosine kinase
MSERIDPMGEMPKLSLAERRPVQESSPIGSGANSAAGTEPRSSGARVDAFFDRFRRFRISLSVESHIISHANGTNAAAIEAYRTLRTRLLKFQASDGMRCVALSSAMPGEGKTLTSMNLAISCAQLHQVRVLLIDADLRTGGLTQLMGQPPAPGLSDVLSGRVAAEGAIFSTELPNLHVLGAGSTAASPPDLFAGPLWKELLRWSREHFTLVLVDSPPVLSLTDFDLISGPCDGILMIVRALRATRTLLQKASAQVDSKKLLGIVYNGAEMEVRYPYPYYSRAEQKT